MDSLTNVISPFPLIFDTGCRGASVAVLRSRTGSKSRSAGDRSSRSPPGAREIQKMLLGTNEGVYDLTVHMTTSTGRPRSQAISLTGYIRNKTDTEHGRHMAVSHDVCHWNPFTVVATDPDVRILKRRRRYVRKLLNVIETYLEIDWRTL